MAGMRRPRGGGTNPLAGVGGLRAVVGLVLLTGLATAAAALVMALPGPPRWLVGLLAGAQVLTSAALLIALRSVAGLRVEVDRRVRGEQLLSYAATHDPLTGAVNRRTMFAALERAVAVRTPVTVLFADLNGFKAVNDAHGHQVGDELLQVVAARLRGVVRPDDVVARYGGDEFVVLATGLGAEAAAGLAQRCRAALGTPVWVSGLQLPIGASVGLAHADRPADAEALLASADAAMYQAKRSAGHSSAA